MSLHEQYLHPSEIFVSSVPYKIITILGTCVAICLYDTKLKIGGINHYMLPFWNGNGLASTKYGNIATPKLLHNLLELGSQKKNIIAKVFGGKEIKLETDIFKIGQRNIQYAITALEVFGIPIATKSVGGDKARKLLFNVHTGEVYMKYLPNSLTLPMRLADTAD